ncbi:DUF3570 domain-containing protein [Ferrimonas pelagia]|uniref:DUF3570 domain-containing protein n=1 Tax=Ferrimonas pelagia TaxID=1177826 RepID=A0ABP9FCJ9_9GAMM
MQLSHNPTASGAFYNISAALAVASAALIATPAQADWFEDDAGWQLDTALLYYGEDGARITAVEGKIQAVRTNADDGALSMALTLDALTGASATGAVAQQQAQTFTRPSGRGEYTTAAGDTPLDDSFQDTRLQLNLGWRQPINARWEYDIASHLSKEYDYLSLGLSGGATYYWNKKNSALRVGASLFYDTIEPEGAIPLPLAQMPIRADYPSEQAFVEAFNATRGNSSDNKRTAEISLGLTQVINRATVMQFNYSYAQVDGYQTDPFKLVSVIDQTGTALRQLYESRPDQRSKHALFWQTKIHLGGPVLDTSYRLMTDDWGIDSHTLDLRFDYRFDKGHYLEPHLRYYRQSAADFYRPFLLEGASRPQYATADYRLAEMTTYTVGLKYGFPVGRSQQASLRLEYYVQTPEGDTGPGQLQSLDLYPQIKALMAQISYRF